MESSKKIFAANWKLNKTPSEAITFIAEFKKQITDQKDFFLNKEIMIFPSSFSLDAISKAAIGTEILFGPQNVYFEKSGAFTGENSADVAKLMGSEIVLIGHSERRQIFSETDELLNKKIKLIQSLDLLPVFCVGETLQQREANETEKICFSQLEKGLQDIEKDQRLVIAYEPVWAIGTGKVASVEQVASVHLQLSKKLKALGFSGFQLLYGGSVKPDNAGELLQVPHVDGFLIGGASLDPISFAKICRS